MISCKRGFYIAEVRALEREASNGAKMYKQE